MLNRKLFSVVMIAVFAALAIVPAFAQDKAEVKVWIAFTDYRLDWTKQKAEIFNAAYPQYNVVVEGYNNYEELFTATALAAEQNALPAIVQYFDAGSRNAVDSGYFKPVGTALGDRTEINSISTSLEDIIAPVAGYYSVDGQLNSVPWNASSSIMFTNTTMTTAAGVEAIPTTWAEMEAACAIIMASADAPEYCFTWPNHGWFFEQWMAQQNQVFANNGNGRDGRATEVAFNSDAGVALLTWLKDMKDKGYLYYSGAQGGDSWGTVDQAFSSQQLAYAVYSSSDTTLYIQVGKDNGYDVELSFLPYNQDAEGGWTGNLIGGGSLWLADGLSTEVEDGALSFLFWLINTENAAEWHQITGYVPVRNSAIALLNSADWQTVIADAGAAAEWTNREGIQATAGTAWFETNPAFAVPANQLAQSQGTPATAGPLVGDLPTIRNYVTAAIDSFLLTDGLDAKTVLDEAAAAANATLAEYNALNG